MQTITTMANDPPERISVRDLAKALGGVDMGNMIQTIGGLIDQFGGKGKGSKFASVIGPLFQQFAGLLGKSGGGPAPSEAAAPSDGEATA